MLERLGNVDVDGFESKLAYYVPADMYSKEGSQADRSELLKFMIRVGLDQEQVFTAYTNAMIHSAERRLQREVYTYSGRFTK